MRRLLAAATALALLAGGCGGNDNGEGAADDDALTTVAPADDPDASGTDSSSSDGPLDACSLLSAEEIEEQLMASENQDLEGGYEVTSTELSSSEDHSTCGHEWVSEAENAGTPMARGEFTVELFHAANLEFTRGEFEEEPIPGIGDEAFFIIDVPHAVVGDLAVSITNFQRTEGAQLELLRAAVSQM